MAKALPIKTKRQSTAAYAASQPLFDTLRTGMERVKEQRANLQIARDTVQKLHVKLPSSSITDNARDSHERYMDGAVKAWRLATESYAEIFEALADVTAAEPSAGREKRDGHEAFAKMASTARDAYEAAMDWKMTTPRSSAENSMRGGQSVDEDEDMEDVSATKSTDVTSQDETNGAAAGAKQSPAVEGKPQPSDSRPTNPILMGLLKKHNVKVEGEQEEIPKEDGVGKVDAAEAIPITTSKDTGKALKRLEKRRKRREKRTFKKGHETTAEDGMTKPAAEPTSTKPQYEDVSAEVAARLKAKDVKKETAKEKKRKRESRDSLPNGEVEVKPEKPDKKKTKSNEGEPVADAAKTEKARKHDRAVEGAIDGASAGERKKRKKA